MSETSATLSLFSLPARSHITVNHLSLLTSAFEKCVTITSWINLGILDLSHELMVSWKPQSCTPTPPTPFWFSFSEHMFPWLYRSPLLCSGQKRCNLLLTPWDALRCQNWEVGSSRGCSHLALKQLLCHADWHKVSSRPANRSFSLALTYGFDCILDRFSLQNAFKLSPDCAGLA